MDILNRVLDRSGVSSSDTTTLPKVKRGIQTAYEKVIASKQWGWLQNEETLNLSSIYETGTATFTNGSKAVTGASTVWTASHVGWLIKMTGYEEVYKVAGRTSNTAITLEQVFNGTTTSAATYILYQPVYSLAADFDDLLNADEAFWPYYPNPVSVDRMRQLYNQYPTTTGKARHYTLLGFDSDGYRKVMVWPIPDENYNLRYDYKQIVPTLQFDGQEPLIPNSWRLPLLVEGGLAEVYDILGDARLQLQAQKFNA
ncbi:MAG: hypothetical protein QMD05_10415, partial [Candidatus Brocadiaceae bacterium]|nr:hypothetical protein [Candidatus Brocadiaceae bacterium]